MPKNKYIPERTCIVCKNKLPKKDLMRFCVKENQIILDKLQKEGGRGAYFCKNCISKIKNTKVKKKLLYALRIKGDIDIVL